MQALYAIGSGGLFGKGLGNSTLIIKYLPEAQNDMIFSIICEETGLFGAILVILLFACLIWRLMEKSEVVWRGLSAAGLSPHTMPRAAL